MHQKVRIHSSKTLIADTHQIHMNDRMTLNTVCHGRLFVHAKYLGDFANVITPDSGTKCGQSATFDEYLAMSGRNTKQEHCLGTDSFIYFI